MKEEIKNEEQEGFTMNDEKKRGEVQDKALNNVVGGDRNASTGIYWSGDEPLYRVGQRVRIRTAPYYDVTEYHNVEITAVGGKTGGTIFKEFVYTVLYDNGKTESDIYESQVVEVL